MRLQLALNVKDLNEAIAYYTKLFGIGPHKIHEGYANFALDQPPLKLVLFENPEARERLNHLGIELFESKQLDTVTNRLSESNILEEIKTKEVCCHAAQDKIWSRDPQGMRWEWYRITDDAPAINTNQSACCTGAQHA